LEIKSEFQKIGVRKVGYNNRHLPIQELSIASIAFPEYCITAIIGRVSMARRRHTGKQASRNISALQFFTDREKERDIIKRFFKSTMEPDDVIEKPILNFYGVGGAGKSSLVKKVIQEWAKESPSKAFKVALVDFDHSEAEKNYTPAHALWDIRSSLARSGVMMYYFDALYAIYWSKTRAGQDANLDLSPLAKAFDFGLDQNETTSSLVDGVSNMIPDSWSEAFGNLFDSADNATSSVKLGIVGAKFFANIRNNQKIKGIAERLDFDQISNMEDKSAEDIQKMMAEVFGIELAETLENDKQSLALVIDGFERIHQKAAIEEHICNFLIYSSLNEDDDPTSRMSTIILGREKLKWRGRGNLGDRTWDGLIESHRLGGLAESDARAFLSKAIGFEKGAGFNLIADLIEKHVDIILATCKDIELDKSDGYHPYYIDLAISIIRDRGEKFDAGRHLGDSPKELQQRFFKYMDTKDKQFHLLLAIAIRFDWPLINAVREKNIVDTPNQLDFDKFIQEHSYIIEFTDRLGQYRLHRLMQDALVDSCDPEEARSILEALKEVMLQRLEGIELLNDITSEQETSYFHLLDMIYMAWEEKLCDMEYIDEAFDAIPAAFKEAYFAEHVEYSRRYLSCVKEAVGDRHPAVARSLNNLAHVLYSQGNYSEAEPLHRESLAMMRELLGDRHPDVAASLNNLALVLSSQGNYSEAEPLYRESLAMSRELLGDRHPDVTAISRSLGLTLSLQNKGKEACDILQNALALSLAEGTSTRLDVLKARIYLAMVYHQLNDSSQSAEYLASAMNNLQELLENEKTATQGFIELLCSDILPQHGLNDWKTIFDKFLD